MKVVHLSDTHGSIVDVPNGDVLIHTGDFSRGRGKPKDCIQFNAWMESLPHKHKFLVPGNHDGMLEHSTSEAKALLPSVRILIDEVVDVDGIRIYGTPWSVRFLDWAFMLEEAALAERYRQWPDGVDILASHGPAYGWLDRLGDTYTCDDMHVGSKSLAAAIQANRPRAVLCGHIHNSYGMTQGHGTLYLNSAIVDDDYKVKNTPQVFTIHSNRLSPELSPKQVTYSTIAQVVEIEA